ncbi:type VII secretion protein EccE [Mycolicibacterium sp. Y3]
MRIVAPGSARITVALLVGIPAAMAYPWAAGLQRWVLGSAVALVVLLLAWWRGRHLTTIVWRRLRLSLRPHRGSGTQAALDLSDNDAHATVVLRLLDGPDPYAPLDLIASYLDRFGLSCRSLRVTSRRTPTGAMTWVGLTMSARANLPALQARSTAIPLRDTAEIALRRLAAELRERGWSSTTSELNIPDLLGPRPEEHWRSVADGTMGFVTAYGMADASPEQLLGELRSQDFGEVWTAIEVSATGWSAACAVRSTVMAPVRPPLSGLTAQPGNQWAALDALRPTSTKRLDSEVFPIAEGALVRWPVDGVPITA